MPTAHFVALRPPYSIRKSQGVQVFLLNPVSFCKLFASFGSTNKSAFSLLLLSNCRSVLATLSSSKAFLLSYTLWPILRELSFLFSSSTITLQWVLCHSFRPGNDKADMLARWKALLEPFAVPCSHSPIISCIYSFLFFDWRRTIRSKFFDTQFSSVSTEELVLPRHDCCVLFNLRCNGHNLLLNSYLYKIGRMENSSCSACGHPTQDTSYLILHFPATDS